MTGAEELIIEDFCSSASNLQVRYLPLSTHVMSRLVQSFSSLEDLTKKLMEGFESDKIKIKIPFADLQGHLLFSMLNNDVPYFTSFQGKVYYGAPKENILIGEETRP